MDEVGLRLAKARAMLWQAQDLDCQAKPEAVIHLCYYAMFHAATAALLNRTGTAPTRHAAVVGQFSALIKDDLEVGRIWGRALNLAFDLRLAADYDFTRTDLAGDAATVRMEAAGFVEYCTGLAGRR